MGVMAAITLTAQPSLSQDSVLVLKAQEYPAPTLDQCKTALEAGKVIKTDADGALHVPFDGFYFVIEVDEKEMRCRMYRHIMGN